MKIVYACELALVLLLLLTLLLSWLRGAGGLYAHERLQAFN